MRKIEILTGAALKGEGGRAKELSSVAADGDCGKRSYVSPRRVKADNRRNYGRDSCYQYRPSERTPDERQDQIEQINQDDAHGKYFCVSTDKCRCISTRENGGPGWNDQHRPWRVGRPI